jgi:PTH1 family peptidyl-tRNA hydrolase
MTILLVGLGNPGASYAGHRHNLGFWAVDAIAQAQRGVVFTEKPRYHLAKGVIKGAKTAHQVFFLKPMTYMNLSGPPAAELARYYRVPHRNVLVFHDDLALPCGKVRVKWGGGHGGHNGLRSLDASLGKDYGRVRLGIGHPGDKDQVTSYVLGNMTAAERQVWEVRLHSVVQHMGVLLDSVVSEKPLSDCPGPFLTQLARDAEALSA